MKKFGTPIGGVLGSASERRVRGRRDPAGAERSGLDLRGRRRGVLCLGLVLVDLAFALAGWVEASGVVVGRLVGRRGRRRVAREVDVVVELELSGRARRGGGGGAGRQMRGGRVVDDEGEVSTSNDEPVGGVQVLRPRHDEREGSQGSGSAWPRARRGRTRTGGPHHGDMTVQASAAAPGSRGQPTAAQNMAPTSAHIARALRLTKKPD